MRSRLYELGCRISDFGSRLAGHPASIIFVALFCGGWFIVGGSASENALTLILSVFAITLTQMVLNQQRRSEIALHIKIDELVLAMKGARDEVAGIEGKTEEELKRLRRDSPDAASDVPAPAAKPVAMVRSRRPAAPRKTSASKRK